MKSREAWLRMHKSLMTSLFLPSNPVPHTVGCLLLYPTNIPKCHLWRGRFESYSPVSSLDFPVNKSLLFCKTQHHSYWLTVHMQNKPGLVSLWCQGFNPHNNSRKQILSFLIVSFQMKTMELNEVQEHAQDHTATNWKNGDSNSALSPWNCILLTPMMNTTVKHNHSSLNNYPQTAHIN